MAIATCLWSAIALGTWKGFHHSTLKDKKNLYDRTFEYGINFYDSAPGYDDGLSERFLSLFLKGKERDKVKICSKVYFPSAKNPTTGLSRKNILKNVESTLMELDTDYLDLLLCHRYDAQTPVDETVEAIHCLVEEGKVLHWGLSAYSTDQVCETYFRAAALSSVAPVAAQYAYNLFNRTIELDLSEALQKLAISLVAYYPLSQGILTGKYSRADHGQGRASDPLLREVMWDYSEQCNAKAERVSELARELNVEASALALRWCLDNGSVKSVLTSVNTLEQLEQNITATSIHYTAEIHDALNEIADNPPVNPYTKVPFS